VETITQTELNRHSQNIASVHQLARRAMQANEDATQLCDCVARFVVIGRVLRAAEVHLMGMGDTETGPWQLEPNHALVVTPSGGAQFFSRDNGGIPNGQITSPKPDLERYRVYRSRLEEPTASVSNVREGEPVPNSRTGAGDSQRNAGELLRCS
jgi:hypothetical protein